MGMFSVINKNLRFVMVRVAVIFIAYNFLKRNQLVPQIIKVEIGPVFDSKPRG